MTTTKFNPTHMMYRMGLDNVPVIVNQKRDGLWLVTDANNTQYWVGKYNVDQIYTNGIKEIK